MLILVAGYVFYGRWLCKQWGVGESSEQTPAHTMEDGVDYVPAKAPILMGHHFSSIAGAGPIGEIISANMSKRAKRLFIIFAYLSLWLSRCNQEKKGKAQSRRNRRLCQEMFVE